MSGTVLGIDSRIAFSLLIGVVAAQRIWELGISSRNRRTLEARGAIEVGAGHYPWMVALHTAFLLSCMAEVWLLHRPWVPVVTLVATLVLGAALILRWWTLTTLGERWTTRVLVVPGAGLVTSGPYRWLRHPNYLVVVMEVASIPMVHCAWLTAGLFSIANLALLRERIRAEDGALRRFAGGAPG